MENGSTVCKSWDAIIVGAGMGGAAAAYALARLGAKVLVLEKGLSTQRCGAGRPQDVEAPQQRLAQGWWPYRIEATVDGKTERRYFPLGCGVGGSSIHYGAAMERLHPCDFEPSRYHKCDEENYLPEEWPISYNELVPYYEYVDRQFFVCGTQDPLSTSDDGRSILAPPPLSPRDQNLQQDFEDAGLHPYRLHVAMRYLPSCSECIGIVCRRDCKIDAENGFLDSAIRFGANLIELADVTSIIFEADRAIGIRANVNGQHQTFYARSVLLAAGALVSPTLLLNSRPMQSDLVGRCLMFHVGNQFSIWPQTRGSDEGPRKSLSLNDFYLYEGVKYGTVQTVGPVLERRVIQNYIKTQILRNNTVFGSKILDKLLALLSIIAARVLGKAQLMTAILEDLPYYDNRVVVDSDTPSGFRIEYTIRDELRSRAKSIKALITTRLKKNRIVLVDRGTRLNFGHPSGTLRAGRDDRTSVVNADCEFHEFENLYVVDASFMPSSGGVNPSATIAANALRVADRIFESLFPGSGQSVLDFAPDGSGRVDCDEQNGEARDVGEPIDLVGRVVLITGASSGLGRALAKGFLGDKSQVIAVGRSADRLLELKSETSSQDLYTRVCDITDCEAVKALVEEIVEKFGRIDVCINNAAVYRRREFRKDTVRGWWSAIETNLQAPMLLSKEVLPHMECQKFGRIVMIGSYADRLPIPGSSSYAVSKGALHTLTKAIAADVNNERYPDLSIMEVIPGVMNTRMGSALGKEPTENYQAIRDFVCAPAAETNGKSVSISQIESNKRNVSLKTKIKNILENNK